MTFLAQIEDIDFRLKRSSRYLRIDVEAPACECEQPPLVQKAPFNRSMRKIITKLGFDHSPKPGEDSPGLLPTSV